MKKSFLEKLLNNKLFLFIVPNLIYVYVFLYHYNNSLKKYISTGEILFYEVIILSCVFLVIHSIIYLFLKNILKNPYKIFLIMCVISCFYFVKMELITFLVYVTFLLILIILVKKYIHFKLDKLVNFISLVILLLFGIQMVNSIYCGGSVLLKSRDYDYNIDIQVDENTNTPNIYWIHCDGMMNLEDMKKYFNFKDTYFKDYLENNNYSYQPNTSLIAGHRTQSALVTLFNPYYYESFFKYYLMELQDSLIQERASSFMVNYYELEEKRLYNELFTALDKKDYTTVAISDFNQYTGLYTDYFYDFFNYDIEGKQVIDKKDFRYIDTHSKNQNEQSKLLSFMRFNHFKSLLKSTMLFPLVENINYLNYDDMSYENENLSEYPYTDKSHYWISKAIISGIHDSLKIEDKKFVFIDFKLNHLPVTFNAYGDLLLLDNKFNLGYYSSNYSYSTKLLVEILECIRKNDENAVVFIQGDHGLHTIDDNPMRSYFGISQEEVQEIRNSVISAYYIPEEYQNGEEVYLNNPLNISRYIINNYVGNNYSYIK